MALFPLIYWQSRDGKTDLVWQIGFPKVMVQSHGGGIASGEWTGDAEVLQ